MVFMMKVPKGGKVLEFCGVGEYQVHEYMALSAVAVTMVGVCAG